MSSQLIMIGVVGAGLCDSKTGELAEKVGELIARRGAAMVCGGLGGVMEHAAKGAFNNGGLTIGILPGGRREDCNPFIKVPIVTDMGHARNIIIAHTAMALIAVEGEYGTLSEISIALKLGKPVACLGKYSGMSGTLSATTAEEAVGAIFEKLQ